MALGGLACVIVGVSVGMLARTFRHGGSIVHQQPGEDQQTCQTPLDEESNKDATFERLPNNEVDSLTSVPYNDAETLTSLLAKP